MVLIEERCMCPWSTICSNVMIKKFIMMKLHLDILIRHSFLWQVHAYERMNRVYNRTLDPCGPVYITVGDGGNIEKVDVDHADEPGKCPSPGDNVPEFGGVCHLNFSSGPAKGQFCWDRQPEWSAYRESSFGHGILEVNLILSHLHINYSAVRTASLINSFMIT